MPTPIPSASNSCEREKLGHRQLGLGQRQRIHVGVIAHVGDNAGDDGGLFGLSFADRGMLGEHVRHLVGKY